MGLKKFFEKRKEKKEIKEISNTLGLTEEEYESGKKVIIEKAKARSGIYELIFLKYKTMFKDKKFYYSGMMVILSHPSVIDCPSGWFSTIKTLFEEIKNHLDTLPKNISKKFKIIQIKEKYMTLRISYDFVEYDTKDNIPIRKAIEKAEKMVEKICSECGEKKKLNKYTTKLTMFYYVLCDNCLNNLKKYEKENYEATKEFMDNIKVRD